MRFFISDSFFQKAFTYSRAFRALVLLLSLSVAFSVWIVSKISIKPLGKRSQYGAIVYLEPMDKYNIQAIGYDMFSEPIRRIAMERARDTGLPSISERVKLVQEIGSEVQPGILMYVPIYKKGMKTDTVEERRNTLFGYVYSPFRMYDLIDTIGIKNENIDFKIYDGLNHDDAHLLYQSSKETSYVSKHRAHRSMELAGEMFEIDFMSTRKFDKEMSSPYPLFFTLLAFVILLAIIVTLAKGRYRLERQKKVLEVNELWLETLLSSSLDGIHMIDFDGNFIEWSPSFIEMLGYNEEEDNAKG